MPETASEKLKAGMVATERYLIELTPDQNYDRLGINSTLSMKAKETLPFMGFELDTRFQVDEVLMNGKPQKYTQADEGIITYFNQPVQTGEAFQMTFLYHGKPKEFHPNYSRLNTIWYPLAWQKNRMQKSGHWIRSEGDLFDAEITLHKESGQMGAFAGYVEEPSSTVIWRNGKPIIP